MAEANGGRLRMRYSWESRLRAVRLVVEGGLSVTAAAAGRGVARSTLYRWLQRYRAEGEAGLRDRSSRPRRSPRRTPAALERRILALRAETRAGPLTVGRVVGVAPSTVGNVLRRHGCSRLPREPRPPVQRYERPCPGDLPHIEIKQLTRFARPGWRALGDGRKRSPGAGVEYAHIAVDDYTRLAYGEVLPSKNGRDAAAWFATLDISLREVLTDNGGGYRTRGWAAQCAALGLRRLYTRPYRPQTNGKAERFIQTLTRGWAHRLGLPTQRRPQPGPAQLAALVQPPPPPRRPHAAPTPPSAASLPFSASRRSWAMTGRRGHFAGRYVAGVGKGDSDGEHSGLGGDRGGRALGVPARECGGG